MRVGTVTTGDPGTEAAVVNSGTARDAVLDFTIPQGTPGSAASPVLLSAYSSPPQSGASGSALLFDLNGPVYGSAIAHTAGSGTFTISSAGVYAAAFHGAFAPASGVTFPLNVTISLQQDGNVIPGGTALHTFHTSSDVANLAFTVPVPVASAPSTLQAVASGGTFVYSAVGMTIYRLGNLPTD